MGKIKDGISHNLALFIAVCFVVAYFAFLQFLSPALYCPDSYYHISVSRFIKDYGPRYDFHWAQISTFKYAFSDKDFLFHVLSIPFLYLSKNIIFAGKLAVVFFNIFFVFSYVFILRKYVQPFLAACILILPLSSYLFSIYFLYLRSITLANIFMIFSIYFLINKKWITVFVLALLYPLAHISFFTVIIFAFICEIIRYFCKKEFFSHNLYAVILGSVLGCFIHPNCPNNLLSFYLNGFLVPLHTLNNTGADLARELFSSPARAIFIDNFAVFFTINLVFWLLFCLKINVSFSTLVWWGCTTIYLVLGFWSNRYWYQVNILFFIFFASFIKDWGIEKNRQNFSKRINILLVAYFALIFIASSAGFEDLKISMRHKIADHIYYEDISRWMEKNIPAGETIYHTAVSDSPFFICLNPKNNYFVVLDPIYMYYPYPKIYALYRDLGNGKVRVPAEVLRKVFNVGYGFVRKDRALCGQIKNDHVNFKILYENEIGIVFKINKTC
jgi:hypothetical protein